MFELKGLNGIKNNRSKCFVHLYHGCESIFHSLLVTNYFHVKIEPTEQIFTYMYVLRNRFDACNTAAVGIIFIAYVVISTAWVSTSVISKRLQLQLQMNQATEWAFDFYFSKTYYKQFSWCVIVLARPVQRQNCDGMGQRVRMRAYAVAHIVFARDPFHWL